MRSTAPLTWMLTLGCLLAAAPLHAGDAWTEDWLFQGEPEGSQPLAPPHRAWKDAQRKVVIIDGTVALREGFLEMFACPRHTKEHEAIVSVDARPSVIHKALVDIGAVPGSPVTFRPEYKPAAGPTVKIVVAYRDAEGKRVAVPAQQWIRNVKTGKPMTASWVFAGSQRRQTEDGQSFYLADDGEFICLANFPSASLDLPIRSTQSNDALAFECLTPAIPPIGTKVRLVLIPQIGSQAKKAE